MINKSAVVIIKRGDKTMADAMEKVFNPPVVKDDRMRFIEREKLFLKKKRTRTIRRMIREAENKYGYNYIPKSTFAKRVREAIAFIEYGFAIFADRFMTIKGVNRRG